MTIRRAWCSGGYSMLELMLAISVLAIAAVSTVSVITTSARQSELNNELQTATNLAKQKLEELQGVTFSEIFVRYNNTTADDPGTGSSPGKYFVYTPGAGRPAADYTATGWAPGPSGVNPNVAYLPNPLPRVLRQQAGLAFVGEIYFPGDGVQLKENVVFPPMLPAPGLRLNLGWPNSLQWDLNLDDLFDASDHKGDYKVLPVVITIRWRGVVRDQVYSLPTILSAR